MKKHNTEHGLPIIHARAAGIDIGSRFHVVAVPTALAEEPVQTFQAFTADLERMAAWLVELGITTVAMESTGVYWIPVYEILETHGLQVILANARDARAVPGRKKPTSTMRNGSSACMLVVYCAPASILNGRSPHCAVICGYVNVTSITLRPISSTCRRH
ncbi:transposase [Aeromonas media]|uniref:IS110 family transposase n=1 Tax=Aeromonas media TaxID=651 RepID=UPI00384CCE40